jgi:hypothetical protein
MKSNRLAGRDAHAIGIGMNAFDRHLSVRRDEGDDRAVFFAFPGSIGRRFNDDDRP